MENSILLYGLSVPLMIAGLAGSVFPALPGVALVWAGMFVYYLLDPANHLSVTFLVIQGLIAASSYIADYLITMWGVKKFGGSRAAAIGAALGSLAVFVMGPIGIIAGPLAGAIIGDLFAGNAIRQALKSGAGSFVGFLFTMTYRLIVCGIMISWFIVRIMFS